MRMLPKEEGGSKCRVVQLCVGHHASGCVGGRLAPRACTMKKARTDRASWRARSGLALRELLAAASGVQADLLAFHFAGVAGDEAGLRQRGLQGRVPVD